MTKRLFLLIPAVSALAILFSGESGSATGTDHTVRDGDPIAVYCLDTKGTAVIVWNSTSFNIVYPEPPVCGPPGVTSTGGGK